MFPPRGLTVYGLPIGMAGGFKGQHCSADGAVVGIDRHPAAFRKAARPGTDRRDGEAPVGFYLLNHGSQRIEVHRNCAVKWFLPLTPQCGADRSSPGYIMGNTEAQQFLAHKMDDLVRVTRRTGRVQQGHEGFFQVCAIDGEAIHFLPSLCFQQQPPFQERAGLQIALLWVAVHGWPIQAVHWPQ